MTDKKKTEDKNQKGYPEVKAGMTIKVHQKIKEKNPKGEEKERIQIFEGIVLSRKHGKESGATITVRKVSEGIGVEKVFPVYSPNVAKIEIVKTAKVKQSKLGYLRTYKKKLKEKKTK
ncbi:MAG: 50S ribosomal protein L19 [Candidatus Komeilibacteria bacterium CG10_big_fil_rev_8_21_14_0_10_41_13]|uniref:50S ribosomal protein L19 n=1 Tax=Candidatus Komeilibacteria bacterium CG10_big_fil_rev_8_21_14_0_10_41_13 TaxID=1974476 RepID=A0A2M6WD59_9BACT|nr:MAG: 50S ribosomal protein L19 [Candidatus Komeilibacteria bacterium CG10_big_fil_rev_8_21_14_0_10_41_13]